MLTAGAGLAAIALWLYSRKQDADGAANSRSMWEYAIADEPLRSAVEAAYERNFDALYEFHHPSLPREVRARRFATPAVWLPTWFSLSNDAKGQEPKGEWTVVSHQLLHIAISARGDLAAPVSTAAEHFGRHLEGAIQSADGALQHDPDDVEAMAMMMHGLQLAGLPDRKMHTELFTAIRERDPEHFRGHVLELYSHGPRVGRGVTTLVGKARELRDGAPAGSARHALIAKAHSEVVMGSWRFERIAPDEANAIALEAERKQEVRDAWEVWHPSAQRDEAFALTAFAIWFWNSQDKAMLREALTRLGTRFDGAAWQDWRADPLVAFNEARKEVGMPPLTQDQLTAP